ncbi:MAG: hypothetical protein OEU56_22310 [Rhodospirillales bacterium]|nr:hypothetical protein [Rhodospirillales bacterium]MDH3969759.1 hypothetical protein [Rhodospirillales bacterium]
MAPPINFGNIGLSDDEAMAAADVNLAYRVLAAYFTDVANCVEFFQRDAPAYAKKVREQALSGDFDREGRQDIRKIPIPRISYWMQINDYLDMPEIELHGVMTEAVAEMELHGITRELEDCFVNARYRYDPKSDNLQSTRIPISMALPPPARFFLTLDTDLRS